MRKILIVFVLLISIYNYGQSGNRFADEENSVETRNTWNSGGNSFNVSPQDEDGDDDDPGNPPNPADLPIDGYISLLFLAAVGIIAVFRYRKTKLS